MGPSPMTVTVSPVASAGVVQAVDHAGERLHQRRIGVGDTRRDEVGIALDDARRDANVLGIRAVVKEQIFAEIGLLVLTVEASPARRGVGRDDAIALAKVA